MKSISNFTENSANGKATRLGLLALYTSVLLLAVNGLFAKSISLDATHITQYRSVIACGFLFAISLMQGASLLLGSGKYYLGVYLLGVLLGLHWITYFHAMQVSSVAIGMLSLFSYPVMTVLIESFFKRRLPEIADVIAGMLVFLGIFLMVANKLLRGEFHDSTIIGVFWGLLSALLFSLRNTVQKYTLSHIHSSVLMAHQTCAVALLLLPFVNFPDIDRLSAKEAILLVLLGVFSTALAHTLFAKSLKYLAAKSVALISCLTPVFGIFFAWLILGEKPGIMVYIGGFIILSVAIFETVKPRYE